MFYRLKNLHKFVGSWRLVFILFCAFLSLGAWWEWGKPQKKKISDEETRKPTPIEAVSTENQIENQIVSEERPELLKGETEATVVITGEPKSKEKEMSGLAGDKLKEKGASREFPRKPALMEVISKEKPASRKGQAEKKKPRGERKSEDEEIKKVQEELKGVIDQTRQLQGRVQVDRTEIQRILERARIHERILRTITAPPVVPTKQKINAEEIIKWQKLRLISEQAHATQERLRVIQQTRSLRASTVTPVTPRASKTS